MPQIKPGTWCPGPIYPGTKKNRAGIRVVKIGTQLTVGYPKCPIPDYEQPYLIYLKPLLMCSFMRVFTTPLLCQVSRSSIAITHITHYFTLFLSLGCFVIISGDSKTTRSISICFKTLARKPRTLSD